MIIADPHPCAIEAFLTPNKEGRMVSADLSGGSISSRVQNDGNKNLFDPTAKQLGKEDFLLLLVTQLKYQDPLQPTENTEFVAQLAQFSSLEGTQNIKESLDGLSGKLEGMLAEQKKNSDTLSQASAASLVGKEVRLQLDALAWNPARTGPLEFKVYTEPGSNSVVSLLDTQNNIVAIFETKDGENTLSWDGSTSHGGKAPAGAYAVVVTTPDGSRDTGYAYTQGPVSGLRFTSEGMKIEVGGQEAPWERVVQIVGNSAPTPTPVGDGKGSGGNS
jgi:flagellar basal-body rod modification protein FlgD